MCSEKPYPRSLFNMNHYWVRVQFQFSEKLFIHITFSKFITSTELLLTTGYLYSSLPQERHKFYSRQKQGVKNSTSFSAKAKQFIRNQTPLTKLVILLDLKRSQTANLGISKFTPKQIICSKISYSTFYQQLPTECSPNSPWRWDIEFHLSSLFSNNNLPLKERKKKASVSPFKRPIPISRHRSC